MNNKLPRTNGPYTGVIDKTDLYWLAYLVFFLIEPLERRSLRYWSECIGILLVFLALYLTFLKRGPLRRQYLLLLAMVGLGAATMPFNAGSTAFLIYGAALMPFVVLSPRWVFSVLLLLGIGVGVEGVLLHLNAWATFLTVFFTLVVGATNYHFAEKERANCKLRMQQEEIEALAAVAERERIARDLHDVLGHTLSVIVLKSELASRLLQRELDQLNPLKALDDAPATSAGPLPSHSANGLPPDTDFDLSSRSKAKGSAFPPAHAAASHLASLQRAQTEMADVERTARTALAEVREAIGGYRALGLAAEIDAARRTLATAGVTLHAEGDLRPATLSAAEETVLALALREAVTNIVRHAQASKCQLRLLAEGNRHRLSIEDDGQHSVTREGNGLRGMRERVEALGGQLSLTREAGTHLLIELPLRS